MKLPFFTHLFCLGICLIGAEPFLFVNAALAAPVPKSIRIMILGVWEVTKSDDGTPPGTTVEFTKDGKVMVKTKVGDETLTMDGTYKLDGDRITLTYKEPGGKESTDTATITKLTDKELTLKVEKGQIDEFKKKK